MNKAQRIEKFDRNGKTKEKLMKKAQAILAVSSETEISKRALYKIGRSPNLNNLKKGNSSKSSLYNNKRDTRVMNKNF